MLNKNYDDIIKNLEKQFKTKNDTDFVKEQVMSLAMFMLGELEKQKQESEAREKNLEKRILTLEKKLESLEKELYEEEQEEYENINCPYCNFNFYIETEGAPSEIKCPECDNIIELDWEDNNEDDDM